MTPLRPSFVVAGIVLSTLVFRATVAKAELTKDQCLDANGQGQELRRTGKFSAAAEELRKCSDSSCPAILRRDCTERLDELQKAQPTIAFEVKDSTGADVSEVRVTLDDKPWAGRLDGTALAVDPGEHVFTFTVMGQPPVTRTFVVTEGEKGRRERIVISARVSPSGPEPTPAVSEPGLPPQPAPEPPASGAVAPAVAAPLAPVTSSTSTAVDMGTQKTAAIAIGAGGVAALAVGSIFGAMASSTWATAKRECPTHVNCSTQALNDHNSAATLATVSTVGFVAGGVLAAFGLTLYVTAPKTGSASVGLHVLPEGLLLTGSF